MASEPLAPRRGRPPGALVRIERRNDLNRHGNPHERLRLHLGRGLWTAIGSPARVTIQRAGGSIAIAAGDEYAVVAGGSIPRVTCDGSASLLEAFPAGRYTATVAGGTIHFTMRGRQP